MTHGASIVSQDAENILDGTMEDFVSFEVGDQLFGIPILRVKDILKLDEITSIPLSSAKVKGSINLRGRIVTVINTRKCLGIGERKGHANRSKGTDMGVTIEQNGDLYTLLVDSIGDVVSVATNSFEPLPGTLDSAWRDYAQGIYRLEGRLMVAIDVDRLLDIEVQ